MKEGFSMRPIKDVIRGLREDRDLKQKDVAKILGVNQQYYSKYETGKYEIPSRHIITLCNFYNVTADYVLGLSESKLPIGNKFNEEISKVKSEKIVEYINKLTNEEKILLMELIRIISDKNSDK